MSSLKHDIAYGLRNVITGDNLLRYSPEETSINADVKLILIEKRKDVGFDDMEEVEDLTTCSVFKATKDGEHCYLAVYGRYSSYDGLIYTGWDFVEPREVTTTQYVKVN